MATNDTPTRWDDLYPGRFLKAGNLPSDGQVVTIAAVRREKIDDDDRVVIRFRELTLELVACVTNGLALRAAFGDDPTKYLGKRVMLAPRKVESFGALVDAVRIVASPDVAADVERVFKRGAGSRTKQIKVQVKKLAENKEGK